MNHPGYYILDKNKNPVPVDDILEWAKMFEYDERTVARDILPGDVRVSTVFLGLDHRFASEGDPILFETLVIGGEYDGYMDRYSTWAEAEEGHKEIIKMIFQ